MKSFINSKKIRNFKNKCMGKLKARNLDFVFYCAGSGLTAFSSVFTIISTALTVQAGKFDPVCLVGPAGVILGVLLAKFGKQIAKYEDYYVEKDNIILSGADSHQHTVGDVINHIEEAGINFTPRIYDDETDTLSR